MDDFVHSGDCQSSNVRCGADSECHTVREDSHVCVCTSTTAATTVSAGAIYAIPQDTSTTTAAAEVTTTECYLPVNECENGSHTCHADATCTDTLEGYDCECNGDLFGNGEQCFQDLCPDTWHCSGNNTLCVVEPGRSVELSDDVGLCICEDAADDACRTTLNSTQVQNDCSISADGGVDLCGSNFECTVSLDANGNDQGLYHCSCSGLPFTCPDTMYFYAGGAGILVVLIIVTLLTVRRRQTESTDQQIIPYVEDPEAGAIDCSNLGKSPTAEPGAVIVTPVRTCEGPLSRSGSNDSTGRGHTWAKKSKSPVGRDEPGGGGGGAADRPSVPARNDLTKDNSSDSMGATPRVVTTASTQSGSGGSTGSGDSLEDGALCAADIEYREQQARELELWRQHQLRQQERMRAEREQSTRGSASASASASDRSKRKKSSKAAVTSGIDDVELGEVAAVDSDFDREDKAAKAADAEHAKRRSLGRRKGSKHRRTRSRSRSRTRERLERSSSDASDSSTEKAPSASNGADSDSAATSGAATMVTVGDRVIVDGYQRGEVKYVGPLQGLPLGGLVFVGVLLDLPQGSGNGAFNGHHYFDAPALHSVFVSADAVQLDTAPPPAKKEKSLDDIPLDLGEVISDGLGNGNWSMAVAGDDHTPRTPLPDAHK